MPLGDDTHAYRRDLPHLEKIGKTYFVTFCTDNRYVLPPAERDIALACCIHDHRLAYWLHCAVIMPDHVHMIYTPFEEYDMATIMSRVKSASAHAIGRHVWQREFFDRIVRASEDLQRKCEYVCANPVRAGLVNDIEDYPWIWRSWIDDAPPRAAAPH